MTDLRMRTTPRSETLVNVTTPQPKSTMAITNQKSEGATSQEAGTTTHNQKKAELTPSESTTTQQRTAGRSQLKTALMGICGS